MLIEIKNDLFDIAWRLKAVDDAYDLFYNDTKRRFEVWADNKLQVVLPYERLDARAVDYVRKTRVERLSRLLAELEEHNLKLAASKQNRVTDEAAYKARHLVGYIDKGGRELPAYEEI